MTAASISLQIENLLSAADRALSDADVFEAERLADEALHLAHKQQDYDRMLLALSPLAAARAQRVEIACEYGAVEIIEQELGEEEDLTIEPGCYLVQPPRVAAEARRLRLLAWQNRTPVFILTREPITQLGLVPVVAIAPGTTIRTKVDPPNDVAAPDIAWLMQAHQDLGDDAIDDLDAELALSREIDALIGMLNALPEHAGLHEALADACRAALEHHSASA